MAASSLRISFSLAILATLLWACGRSPQSPSNEKNEAACASGSYRIDGLDAGNSGVMISARQATCRARWDLGHGVVREGVGLPVDGSIVLGWGSGKEYGSTVYTIHGGELEGVDTENKYDNLAVENLSGPAGLHGTYKIVKAATHDGTAYHGTLEIKREGDVYVMKWTTICDCKSGPRREAYIGVGIRRGDKLLAGWGSEGSEVELADYSVSDRKLEGTVARRGSPKIETRTLIRR